MSIQAGGSANTYIQGTGTANSLLTTGTTTTGSSHTHTLSGTSSGASSEVAGTDKNLPPYYKLAYIQRIV